MIKFRYVRNKTGTDVNSKEKKSKEESSRQTKVSSSKNVIKRKKESTNDTNDTKQIPIESKNAKNIDNYDDQSYDSVMPGVTNKEYQSCVKSIFVSLLVSYVTFSIILSLKSKFLSMFSKYFCLSFFAGVILTTTDKF